MKLNDWVELSNDPSGLLFEKELLPVGSYFKWSPETKKTVKFDITKEFLDHVAGETEAMNKGGVPSKLYLNHDRDASKRRGDVVALEIKKNDRGVDSLFGKIKFADEEAKREGLRNDVSVSIPPMVMSGDGRSYTRPLEHVAITSNPVVPGLGNYVAISASFDMQPPGMPGAPGMQQPGQPGQQQPGQDSQFMNSIMQALGLQPSGDEKRDLQMAMAAIQRMKQGGQQQPQPQQPGGAPGMPQPNRGFNMSNDFKVPTALAQEMAKSRVQRVEALVKSGKLSPQERDNIVKSYCTNDCVKIDLSMDDDSVSTFDALVSSYERNVEFSMSGRSEPSPNDEVIVSFTHSEEEIKRNPLLRNMAELASQDK